MNERLSRKLKFRPIVSRVKLNPEQAVLNCGCFDGTGHISGQVGVDYAVIPSFLACQTNAKNNTDFCVITDMTLIS